MKNSLLASVVLVSTAVAAQASGGIPVPLVECLFPPSYRGENICHTDWIFIPIYW